MSGIEYIASALEVLLMYSVVCMIDSRNRLSLLKLISATILLVISLSFVNTLELSYHVLLTTALILIVFVIISKRNFFDCASDFLLTLIIVAILEFLLLNIVMLINEEVSRNEYLQITLMIILIAIINVLRKTKIWNVLLEKKYRKYKHFFFIASFNVIILLSIFVDLWVNHKNIFWEKNVDLIVILVIYLFINGLLIISLINYRKVHNQSIMFRDYSNYQKELIFKLKSREHDFHGHLNAITAILDQCNDAKTKELITNYMKQVQNRNSHSNISGISDNTVLSAFIHHIKVNAEAMRISFTYSIDKIAPAYKIPDYELIEMLTNLFDNAFEAIESSDLSTAKKEMIVLFERRQITVINSVDKDLSGEDISRILNGHSSKGKDRGMGLLSVHEIAKSNNIMVDMSSHDKFVHVVLNFQDETVYNPQ